MLDPEKSKMEIKKKIKKYNALIISTVVVIVLNIFFFPKYVNRNKVFVARKDLFDVVNNEEISLVEFDDEEISVRLYGSNKEYISKSIEDEEDLNGFINILNDRKIEYKRHITEKNEKLREISKFWLIPFLLVLYSLWLVGV